ncbi:hypothetical protein NLM59_09345 [Weeksellaceae bacterium KMM 9724]|uniref:transglutaminase domain-containing protein n=1 Tax=Profundicola chukchiensis TaxID=2961959 RepID=UPI00243DE537|nr:transglutaminase domain-containing protein [Profundicola chukchiensis]MDG4951131.1 hypothetical protein [Profundicola chukchiensis]
MIRFSQLLIFLIFSLGFIHAQDARERIYTFTHPDKVYDFQEYESASIKQTVDKKSNKEVVVKLRFKTLKNPPKSKYPIQNLPKEYQKYLQPSSHIESNHPSIAKIAAQIKKEANTNDLNMLVKNVLHWNVGHLSYGFPNKIHSAVEAYDQKVVNCIGYSHLPAAILRNLGVPTRVMRTYVINGRHITRHYMMEVYFPEEDYWLTIEPQTAALPFTENVVLYVDENWNQAKHKVTRDFSLDPKTKVKSGTNLSVNQINELKQLPKPEAKNINQRDLLGRVMASNDTYLATLGFKYPEARRSQIPDIHSHNNQLFIYKNSGNQLKLVQKINPSEGFTEANFKRVRPSMSPIFLAGAKSSYGFGSYDYRSPAMAMTDNRLAIGLTGISANSNSNGVIVIYELDKNNKWVLKQKLSLDNHPGAGIGESLAMHGPYLYVGDPEARAGGKPASGKVYVFKEERSQYVFKTELEAKSPASFSYFGYGLDADDNRLIVSSTSRFDPHQMYGDERQGAVYVYKRNGDKFSQEAVLKAKDGHARDMFGFSLALDGNSIAVGAPLHKSNAKDAGAAYVFGFDGKTWQEKTKLSAASPLKGDNFGAKVALCGSDLFVSAPNASTDLGEHAGAIYHFKYTGLADWETQNVFTAKNEIIDNPDANSDGRENLGHDFSLMNQELIAGAPGMFGHPYAYYNNMGGLYQFKLPADATNLQKLSPSLASMNTQLSISPNPMVVESKLEFAVPKNTKTQLVLKNQEGKQVDYLLNKNLSSGVYQYNLSSTRLYPGNYQLELIFPEDKKLKSSSISFTHLAEKDLENVR